MFESVPLVDNFLVLIILAANSSPVDFCTHRRTILNAPLYINKFYMVKTKHHGMMGKEHLFPYVHSLSPSRSLLNPVCFCKACLYRKQKTHDKSCRKIDLLAELLFELIIVAKPGSCVHRHVEAPSCL